MRAILAAICLFAAGAAAAQPAPRFMVPEGAPPTLPFSPVVVVGNVVYLSGMLGIDPATRALAPGGVEAETEQTLKNIQTALGRLNLTMDSVFKCVVMLADISEFAAFNRAYIPFFTAGRRPARSTFGVSGLVLGARVEIECMAHAPAG
jgi:2-iminobutanoate/2-iminopropanoate deaminase